MYRVLYVEMVLRKKIVIDELERSYKNQSAVLKSVLFNQAFAEVWREICLSRGSKYVRDELVTSNIFEERKCQCMQ